MIIHHNIQHQFPGLQHLFHFPDGINPCQYASLLLFDIAAKILHDSVHVADNLVEIFAKNSFPGQNFARQCFIFFQDFKIFFKITEQIASIQRQFVAQCLMFAVFIATPYFSKTLNFFFKIFFPLFGIPTHFFNFRSGESWYFDGHFFCLHLNQWNAVKKAQQFARRRKHGLKAFF